MLFISVTNSEQDIVEMTRESRRSSASSLGTYAVDTYFLLYLYLTTVSTEVWKIN